MDGAMKQEKTFKFVGQFVITSNKDNLECTVDLLDPITRPSKVGSFFRKKASPTPFLINKFTSKILENGKLVSTGG